MPGTVESPVSAAVIQIVDEVPEAHRLNVLPAVTQCGRMKPGFKLQTPGPLPLNVMPYESALPGSGLDMSEFKPQMPHLPDVALSVCGGRAPGTGSRLTQGLLGAPAQLSCG